MIPKKRLEFESKVPVYLAILAMVGLQIAVSDKLTIGPKYMLAEAELLLLFGTAITHAADHPFIKQFKRSFSLLLVVVVTLTNIASLFLVVFHLLNGGSSLSGHVLIFSAFAIYLTNIIIFGLWYWELDSPGLTGFTEPKRGPDFLFPQMTAKGVHPAIDSWYPKFLDYLYISITNASAFSPTDALPLTRLAKSLMTIQSMTSLITVALVAARAVNILN